MKQISIKKQILSTFLLVTWGFLPGFPVLAQTPSLSECREIEDSLARFNCYEQLEEAGEVSEPSNQGATRANTVRTERPAASQGLPVIRRPNSAAIRNNKQEQVEQEERETTAVIESNSESRPFYRRIWHFGGDDDSNEENESEELAAEPKQEVTSSEVDAFGRSSESQEPRIVEGEKGGVELHDIVAAIRVLTSNRLQITLESGQVWRQLETKRYLLKEGDEVRIYPTIWGSNYRLTSDRLKSYIQVVRVD